MVTWKTGPSYEELRAYHGAFVMGISLSSSQSQNPRAPYGNSMIVSHGKWPLFHGGDVASDGINHGTHNPTELTPIPWRS